MTEVHYICTGSCHGVATEEQHSKGATTCAAKECEKHGHPLEKRHHCAKCKQHHLPNEKHDCK